MWFETKKLFAPGDRVYLSSRTEVGFGCVRKVAKDSVYVAWDAEDMRRLDGRYPASELSWGHPDVSE